MKGLSVLQLAEKVLTDLGDCPGFAGRRAVLGRIKGLGPAKSAELMAVMELARRSLHNGLQTQPVFGKPRW